METNNIFNTLENQGRAIFETYCLKDNDKIQNYNFTQDPFCPYDLEYTTTDGNTVCIEIKYRQNFDSTEYFVDAQGLLFEEKKFDNMKKEIEKNPNKHFYYCTIFADNVFYFHELRDKDFYNWFDRKCQKSQEEFDKFIYKKVTYINTSDCIKKDFNKKTKCTSI